MPDPQSPGERRSLPLYHTEDRRGFPAGVLQSAQLTPDMLAQNLRAGLFPEKGARIRNSIEAGLARQAWLEVKSIESLHRRQCPNVKVTKVQIIHSTNDAHTGTTPSLSQSPLNVSESAAVIEHYPLPLPTRMFVRLFHDSAIPHLTYFSPSRPSPPPSLSQSQSDDGSSVTYHGPHVLGTELWTVDRCSVSQRYLVHYVGDGDAFYTNVYPVNWSGALDCMRVRAKRFFGLS